MEINKTKKTLFGRFMSKVRHDTLAERIAAAKAEAEEKETEFDLEKAKVEFSPNNEETKFLALKRIYDAIEAEKPECLKFLLAPGYDWMKWIDSTIRLWDDKYLPEAMKASKDAAHYTPVQALTYIKTARNAAAEKRKATQTPEDIEAAKAARKERKAEERKKQQNARATKEPERRAAREARKAKKAAKGGNNNGGGKSKKKKG